MEVQKQQHSINKLMVNSDNTQYGSKGRGC